MRKNFIVALTLFLGISLLICPVGFAVEETFTIQATVPNATGATINAYSVPSGGGSWTSVSTTLNFGSLTYDSENGIYLPGHYYVLEVAPQGGSGLPSVTATYTEGANPNDSVSKNGLGWKATATFLKTVWVGPGPGDTQESPLSTHGPKKLLKDLSSGEQILDSELTGGWLRIYVGVVSKDPDADYPDPGNAEVFSNSDMPGAYDGTLHISVTGA